MTIGPNATSLNGRSALRYATLGFAVFPLNPKLKIPLKGSHGFKDATHDESKIRVWWTEHPDASIGIATGAISGIVVIDLDNHPEDGKDGLGEWDKLLARHKYTLPDTAIQITGTGGKHILFQYPGFHVSSGESVLAHGIDRKGDGGYVVAAPSISKNGTPYKWVDPSAVSRPFAEAPDWVLAAADKNHREYAPGEKITKGHRNQAVFDEGAFLRKHDGLEAEEILGRLLAFDLEHCDPVLV